MHAYARVVPSSPASSSTPAAARRVGGARRASTSSAGERRGAGVAAHAVPAQNVLDLALVEAGQGAVLQYGVAAHAVPAQHVLDLALVEAGQGAVLPAEYGYVMQVAAATYVLTQWQALNVSAARKEYGVRYPRMYEDEREGEPPSRFNCVQRAHQNTLEAVPAFTSLLLLAGVGHPVWSSFWGAAWIAARVKYSQGYYTGDPEARLAGGFPAALALLVLLFTTCKVGWQLTGVLPFLR